LFGGAVFERAVLDQLGIKSAVSGVVQVFKEDAEQIGADRFAWRGDLNRDRCFLSVNTSCAGSDCSGKDGNQMCAPGRASVAVPGIEFQFGHIFISGLHGNLDRTT